MNRSAEIPWIHFGALSNLWHEHRSTMRGHWLSAFYHISLKREKCWVFDIIYFEAYIIWFDACVFNFGFYGWESGSQIGSQGPDSSKLLLSAGPREIAKVEKSRSLWFSCLWPCCKYLYVLYQARLCNSVWVLSIWFVYDATAKLVKVIDKSKFCP